MIGALRREDITRNQPKRVQLDWKAYFQEFCGVHGGNPVKWGGKRLLFNDGWMYSIEDYAGPEYPPPVDPRKLRHLQVSYWYIRREVVQSELRFLAGHLDNLEMQQEDRSAPLQQQFPPVFNEQLGRNTSERGEIDYELLNTQLQFYRDDLKNCEDQMQQLQERESETEHGQ